MQSNRESARRSRMKKQKRFQDRLKALDLVLQIVDKANALAVGVRDPLLEPWQLTSKGSCRRRRRITIRFFFNAVLFLTCRIF